MVGQLPVRHQVVLWTVGLLASVGAGAWLALSTPGPLVWQYGAILGALAGPALIVLYCRSLTVGAPRARASGR